MQTDQQGLEPASQCFPALSYAELQVTTNFTFLEGGSHAEELVATAQALGHSAIAVTDCNTLAGAARMHLAAKAAGLRFVVGAKLRLVDESLPDLLCFPTHRMAYGRLSRLLTLGKRRASKGKCSINLADVAEHADGQIFVVVPPEHFDWRDVAEVYGNESSQFRDSAKPQAPAGLPQRHTESFAAILQKLQNALSPETIYLSATHLYLGEDRARLAALARLASVFNMPLVATNDVHYHSSHRRPLHNVLTAIRAKSTVADASLLLQSNAERHLKSLHEMSYLFRGYEASLTRTIEIVDACKFSMEELVYEYPDEPVPSGKTAQAHLEDLTADGAKWRYPAGIPPKISTIIARELALIDELKYAHYFLTVYDIVHFAKTQGILCQGRGSAANSAVCYCLGITSVNPTEIDVLFDRFISPERKEPPDIDVDFEHERREEVIQYIYARYGRDRAGLAATVISYRARSAVRETGKAMGLTEDTLSALSGMVWGTRSGGSLPEKHIREAGFDPQDPYLARTLELAQELMSFPRHLSQHVGGFVLTRGPLCEVVPISNAAMEHRTNIEWDKDDLDAMGLLKVDVLGLGMLTCIRKGFELLRNHYGVDLNLGTVPRDDAAVYDMLCAADSLGVFQVESRAQMNMLPRLKPRCFYDLVIQVAIVRPGPIQGDMVHPYLRRRSGIEPEDYPSPSPEHGPADELRQILGKTKGVPLFQEQAMRIAMVAAKFTPQEANELRLAMATFRRKGTIGLLEEKMVSRMVARGYSQDFAHRCFNQIKGFGYYGFPESHAASFALLVYVSAWLKCHYPAVFAAALLNSQPMGFYAPAQIVRDAREHGVEVLEPDVSFSAWDTTLEAKDEKKQDKQGWSLRLGMRQIDGLRMDEAERIVAARGLGTGGDVASTARSRRSNPAVMFSSIEDLRRIAGVQTASLQKLAAADAFGSLGMDRRRALWEVRGLPSSLPLPLFGWAEARETGEEAKVALPRMPLSEHVICDYQTLRLSLKAHPMSFLRSQLKADGVACCNDLRKLTDGLRVSLAGVILVRQRPGTANGVVFMTLEDETGIANTVVWPQMLEQYRKVVMGGRLILVRGRIQRQDNVIHLIAEYLEDRSDWLARLAEDGLSMPIALARADEVVRPEPGSARGQTPEPGTRDSIGPEDPANHAPVAAESKTLRYRNLHGRHPRNEKIIPKSRDFH